MGDQPAVARSASRRRFRDRSSLYLAGVAALALGAVVALVYVLGGADGYPQSEFDKPTFDDFAEAIAYGDLAIVGTVVAPGQMVEDHGIDLVGEPASGEEGLPVGLAQVRIEQILSSHEAPLDEVRDGDVIAIIIGQTVYGGGASAAQKSLAAGDELLLALEYLPAGSSAVTDTDAFTPVGMDNGVVAIHDGDLTPWEAVVTTVAGTPVRDMQLAHATAVLSDSR